MMFEKLSEAIKEHETIIIHRHANPDGDALGSQIGLKHIITENFPGKKVFCVGDGAKRYSFMDESEMDNIPDEAYDNALAIILDSATRPLISDERYKNARYTARVDHHIYCETFTDIEIVDTTFESCCGMIAYFAMEQDLRLDTVGARSLYTGLVTDSGRFRYDSTSSRTFEIAAFICKTEFSHADIYRNLYCDDLDNVKLRASFIQKINDTGKGVAYIYTTKEEIEKYGADTFTVSRGMVNVMSDIRGIDIWVNFTESDGKVLCELRSSKYNINKTAVKYGGGGHEKASGASVKDKNEAMEMIKDLIEVASL